MDSCAPGPFSSDVENKNNPYKLNNKKIINPSTVLKGIPDQNKESTVNKKEAPYTEKVGADEILRAEKKDMTINLMMAFSPAEEKRLQVVSVGLSNSDRYERDL